MAKNKKRNKRNNQQPINQAPNTSKSYKAGNNGGNRTNNQDQRDVDNVTLLKQIYKMSQGQKMIDVLTDVDIIGKANLDNDNIDMSMVVQLVNRYAQSIDLLEDEVVDVLKLLKDVCKQINGTMSVDEILIDTYNHIYNVTGVGLGRACYRAYADVVLDVTNGIAVDYENIRTTISNDTVTMTTLVIMVYLAITSTLDDIKAINEAKKASASNNISDNTTTNPEPVVTAEPVEMTVEPEPATATPGTEPSSAEPEVVVEPVDVTVEPVNTPKSLEYLLDITRDYIKAISQFNDTPISNEDANEFINAIMGHVLSANNATDSPVVTPTPDPVVTPTPDPVVTPTPDPVVTPTPDPVVTPTPDSTATINPAPTTPVVQPVVQAPSVVSLRTDDPAYKPYIDELVELVNPWVVNRIDHLCGAYIQYSEQYLLTTTKEYIYKRLNDCDQDEFDMYMECPEFGDLSMFRLVFRDAITDTLNEYKSRVINNNISTRFDSNSSLISRINSVLARVPSLD